jgi:hypothetical protein
MPQKQTLVKNFNGRLANGKTDKLGPKIEQFKLKVPKSNKCET